MAIFLNFRKIPNYNQKHFIVNDLRQSMTRLIDNISEDSIPDIVIPEFSEKSFI